MQELLAEIAGGGPSYSASMAALTSGKAPRLKFTDGISCLVRLADIQHSELDPLSKVRFCIVVGWLHAGTCVMTVIDGIFSLFPLPPYPLTQSSAPFSLSARLSLRFAYVLPLSGRLRSQEFKPLYLPDQLHAKFSFDLRQGGQVSVCMGVP